MLMLKNWEKGDGHFSMDVLSVDFQMVDVFMLCVLSKNIIRVPSLVKSNLTF
jgi:hypothetical protein